MGLTSPLNFRLLVPPSNLSSSNNNSITRRRCIMDSHTVKLRMPNLTSPSMVNQHRRMCRCTTRHTVSLLTSNTASMLRSIMVSLLPSR